MFNFKNEVNFNEFDDYLDDSLSIGDEKELR